MTSEKKMQFPGQSGWPAEPASRAVGTTGYFGRESMLGIYIDGPSRAVRYSSRAPRPGRPCPTASISSIKFGLVNELNLSRSSHRVCIRVRQCVDTRARTFFASASRRLCYSFVDKIHEGPAGSRLAAVRSSAAGWCSGSRLAALRSSAAGTPLEWEEEMLDPQSRDVTPLGCNFCVNLNTWLHWCRKT